MRWCSVTMKKQTFGVFTYHLYAKFLIIENFWWLGKINKSVDNVYSYVTNHTLNTKQRKKYQSAAQSWNQYVKFLFSFCLLLKKLGNNWRWKYDAKVEHHILCCFIPCMNATAVKFIWPTQHRKCQSMWMKANTKENVFYISCVV